MVKALLFYQAHGHAPGIISFADTGAVQVSIHTPDVVAGRTFDCAAS